MYIKSTVCGYEYGRQVARRQLFLLLIEGQGPNRDKIKCAVRKVALRQLGHFMMGRVRIYGDVLSVSGSYGNDGLPMRVPDAIYDRLTVFLPQDLYDAWNNGGGGNSAGSEAAAMREWALEHLKELRK